jgi:hypothetical protein
MKVRKLSPSVWPTGISATAPDSADNARTINYTAPNVVAPWRAPRLLERPRLLSNGSFEFEIGGPTGGSCDVQASTDLVNWTTLAARTLTEGADVFVDADAANFSRRFYRTSAGTGNVSSMNSVGFYKVLISSGYSMIANHLNSANNTVSALFPNPAEGTRLDKWDEGLNRWISNVYDFGQWLNPYMSLAPGEGALMRVAVPTMLTFVGEVEQGRLHNPLGPGYSIRSMRIPLAGGISSNLSFPPQTPDKLFLMSDHATPSYTQYEYKWDGVFGHSPVWLPNEPQILLGESFFINSDPILGERDWVFDFSIYP